jgi:hypothetical protein
MGSRWHVVGVSLGRGCDFLRSPAEFYLRRFLRRGLVGMQLFPKNTVVVTNPTRGATPLRHGVAVRGRRWHNLLPLGVSGGCWLGWFPGRVHSAVTRLTEVPLADLSFAAENIWVEPLEHKQSQCRSGAVAPPQYCPPACCRSCWRCPPHAVAWNPPSNAPWIFRRIVRSVGSGSWRRNLLSSAVPASSTKAMPAADCGSWCRRAGNWNYESAPREPRISRDSPA